jgi:hypothetical protein
MAMLIPEATRPVEQSAKTYPEKCVICRLSDRPHAAGFYLPHMAKSDLFKTVILDGSCRAKLFLWAKPMRNAFTSKAARSIYNLITKHSGFTEKCYGHIFYRSN